ncbi:hypothetical protein HMPREF9440_00783 [Sutterella parvirubra YIT 11816]|uniref:Uncharacterized protein n=1 Tax=Sutterella parvirubra YIT 11816 TaxID=762967 RepID=H3KDH4_9BURK|nr:hypothetical protein HMPREF9440_00783 [Sutterella parvirubra YIT 11816]
MGSGSCGCGGKNPVAGRAGGRLRGPPGPGSPEKDAGAFKASMDDCERRRAVRLGVAPPVRFGRSGESCVRTADPWFSVRQKGESR